MEGPAELGPDVVLRFLTERGGRAAHAELLRHFGDALGGPPERRARARARFKEQVNAVASVHTDPADGVKYVQLKRRFCPGSAPSEDAPPGDAPRIQVTAEPEAPEPPAELGDPGRRPEEETPRRDGEPGDDPEPPPASGGEADRSGSPGGPPTSRSARQNLRDSVTGTPQLARSAGPGAGSPGGSSGGGRGRGGGESDSASVASSSTEEDGSAGVSVTLDPLEHAWMLSAADGKWDSLEGLLSCDPGLLAKRDFITGFNCLHWAAKQGKQELLAMLVNFANQHRLPVNINARSSGGYTALHLAAMHGHVEVMKLLVGAYDADVDIRDYSGRKASHYLSPSIAEEIKNLVGVLDDEEEDGDSAGGGGGGGRWRLSKVLPAHLITYKLSHGPEDGADHHHHHHHLAEGWAGSKTKEPSRKALGSSSGRMKPRLNKIRFKTQIIHSTLASRDADQPLEEGEEEEEEDRPLKGHSSSKLRPKSNVFG